MPSTNFTRLIDRRHASPFGPFPDLFGSASGLAPRLSSGLPRLDQSPIFTRQPRAGPSVRNLAADTAILHWLNNAPIWTLGTTLLAALLAAAALGRIMRPQASAKEDHGEGYSVSAILGLLALLTGFTFSLAIERFESRRQLVLEHANAIGTAYLRVQLLPEPHRTRLSGLIVRYTDNVINLARARPEDTPTLLAKDDELLTELWAATAAGYDSVKTLPFSAPFIASINSLVDNDGARRAARSAHVPIEVFAVLLIYLVGTAAVLGYVLRSRRGLPAAAFLLVLLTLSQLLILDIDRPTTGRIRESQQPIEDLNAALAHQPPAVFDHWRDRERPP